MRASMTIAIPSCQRRGPLLELLRSIESAVASPHVDASQIDVVVVLDGSDDGSIEMVEEVAASFPVPLRWRWQANAGLAAARNACVDLAGGELVWLIDDDMRVTASALAAHLDHPRSPAAIVMGPCTVESGDPDVTAALWWYAERHVRLAEDHMVTDPRDSSFANTSLPAALLRHHRFDERFVGYGIEDYELALRLQAAGQRIAFEPAAAVTHRAHPTRDETLRKMRQEGMNRMRFVALHPDHADVAFGADPGKLDRALRQAARLPIGPLLWGLARALDAAAGRLPRSAARRRLFDIAAKTAGASGVASMPGRSER